MSNNFYRSIFISDIHLGTKEAKIDYLIDFLKKTESEYLYLIGDVFDFWKLKSGWYWPPLNNEIIRIVEQKVKQGTRVIYIPGNHDSRMRDYAGANINGVEIQLTHEHISAKDKRYLILHGDEFDSFVITREWLSNIGSWSYDALLRVNHYFNAVRHRLGMPYWSLSAFVKSSIKNSVKHIERYESVAIERAKSQNMHGIICGHIHKPANRTQDGINYLNTGDWVETCSAIVEDQSGEFHLIDWIEKYQNRGELVRIAA